MILTERYAYDRYLVALECAAICAITPGPDNDVRAEKWTDRAIALRGEFDHASAMMVDADVREDVTRCCVTLADRDDAVLREYAREVRRRDREIGL